MRIKRALALSLALLGQVLSPLLALAAEPVPQSFLSCLTTGRPEIPEVALAVKDLEERAQGRLNEIVLLTQLEPQPTPETFNLALEDALRATQADEISIRRQFERRFSADDSMAGGLSLPHGALISGTSTVLADLAQKLAVISFGVPGKAPGLSATSGYLLAAASAALSGARNGFSRMAPSERSSKLPGLASRLATSDLNDIRVRALLPDKPGYSGYRLTDPFSEAAKRMEVYERHVRPGVERLGLRTTGLEAALDLGMRPPLPGDFSRRPVDGSKDGIDRLNRFKERLDDELKGLSIRDLQSSPTARHAAALGKVASLERVDPTRLPAAIQQLQSELKSQDEGIKSIASRALDLLLERNPTTQIEVKLQPLIPDQSRRFDHWHKMRDREKKLDQRLLELNGGDAGLVRELGLSGAQELVNSNDPILAQVQRDFMTAQSRVGKLLLEPSAANDEANDEAKNRALEDTMASADLAWISLQCRRSDAGLSVPPIAESPNRIYSRIDFSKCKNEGAIGVGHRAINRKLNVDRAWIMAEAAATAAIVWASAGLGGLAASSVATSLGTEALVIGANATATELIAAATSRVAQEVAKSAASALFGGSARAIKDWIFNYARGEEMGSPLAGIAAPSPAGVARVAKWLSTEFVSAIVGEEFKSVLKGEGEVTQLLLQPVRSVVKSVAGEAAGNAVGGSCPFDESILPSGEKVVGSLAKNLGKVVDDSLKERIKDSILAKGGLFEEFLKAAYSGDFGEGASSYQSSIVRRGSQCRVNASCTSGKEAASGEWQVPVSAQSRDAPFRTERFEDAVFPASAGSEGGQNSSDRTLSGAAK